MTLGLGLSLGVLCLSWFAAASPPANSVLSDAQELVASLEHCHDQGRRSVFGVIQCARAKRQFTKRLRDFFEHGDGLWQYNDFLASTKGTAELDWNSSKLVQIRQLPVDGSGLQVFVVRLPHISLTLQCNASGQRCQLDRYEWPFTFAELYCTSPLKVMKDFHVAILRNPALARVAEQVFEQPDGLADGEPARTPVTRKLGLLKHKAYYRAPDFELEVDLPDLLHSDRIVEGQLKSFAIYGSAVPLDCQWRD